MFERTNGGSRQTTAGQELLETAGHIIAESDAAFARLKAWCRGEPRRSTLDVYTSLSTGNLRPTHLEHHRRFSELNIHTIDGSRNRLPCELLNRALDVVIMTSRGPAWNDDSTLPLWSERVIVALSDVRSLATRPSVRWRELAANG